jgi:hypothetical protein
MESAGESYRGLARRSNSSALRVLVATNAALSRRTPVKDVGQVHDGNLVQQNIVRTDGHRSVLLSIIKNGNASTLSVVNAVKDALVTARREPAADGGFFVPPLSLTLHRPACKPWLRTDRSFWLQLEAPSTAAVTVAILAEPTRGKLWRRPAFA